MDISWFQSGLLEYTGQCARGQLIARLPGIVTNPVLMMSVLAMAATRSH